MAHVLHVDVLRPIDEVFDFLADLRHAPEWNEPSLRVQQIGNTPIAIGTQFREKNAKLGELTTELVRYDRPHGFSFRTTDGHTTIDGEVKLTAVSGGTHVKHRDAREVALFPSRDRRHNRRRATLARSVGRRAPATGHR